MGPSRDLYKATGMNVDQDPQEQGTPPGTPFDEGFTPLTSRGQISANPTISVYTENYVNTNQQTPTLIRTRLAAIRDAKLAVAAAVAAIN